MANIIPIHKKEAKYLVKKYRPISLLPIFAKVFEILLFNSLFSHFHNNKLFTKCQSGFMPCDFSMSQLQFHADPNKQANEVYFLGNLIQMIIFLLS